MARKALARPFAALGPLGEKEKMQEAAQTAAGPQQLSSEGVAERAQRMGWRSQHSTLHCARDCSRAGGCSYAAHCSPLASGFCAWRYVIFVYYLYFLFIIKCRHKYIAQNTSACLGRFEYAPVLSPPKPQKSTVSLCYFMQFITFLTCLSFFLKSVK